MEAPTCESSSLPPVLRYESVDAKTIPRFFDKSLLELLIRQICVFKTVTWKFGARLLQTVKSN